MIVLWAKVIWASLDGKLADAIQRMSNSKKELENEAKAANIDIGFAREQAAEQRHQAVLGIIPAALRMQKLIKPTFIVPESRNSLFTGRFSELLEIQGHLVDSKIPNQVDLKTVAIRGIGGIGKTQLANEYAFKYRQSFRGVFWVRAEDTTIMQQDFAQIGRTLDTQGASGMDLKGMVQVAKDWLSGTRKF